VARELGHLLQVGQLRVSCQIPHLHVLGHALSKRCHLGAPLRIEFAASSSFRLSQ
jgi:hypothetical protein